MSYVLSLASLKQTIAAVPGIARVIIGYPTSVHVWPLVYLEAESGDRGPSPPNGQVIKNRWRILASLCVPMQDNTTAEDQIAGFIDSIPLAIRVVAETTRQQMWCSRWATGVRAIGGSASEPATTYRVVDFTVEVIERDA